MNKKKEIPQPQRQPIPVRNPDPNVGLSSDEALVRQKGGWGNVTANEGTRTEKQIIRENVLTFFNMVFIILAVILLISGSHVKNLTFLVVVICNTVIGCFQEIRAKRAVDKLTLVAAQQVRTIREGQILRIRSDKIVRDDIVEFTTGDQICADGIVRSGELQVNESLITGEADAIVKRPGDSLKSGSFVISGTARVQLTKVGSDSFAVRLSAEAKANTHAAKSEMMRSLDRLIRVVGYALIPIGIIMFYQECFVLDMPFRKSVEATVSALIGMIPEGLYLLTSIAMAASAMKLTRKKVLVQDMNCIETLARVDVLCVDKTGTITEAKMEVNNVIPLTEDPPEHLEQVLAAIYTGVEPENDTARAMSEMFAGSSDWDCIRRVPFNSQTKWSAAIFRQHGAYIIGAPEFSMGNRYGEIRQTVEQWSCQGFRVLLISRYEGEVSPRLDTSLLRPLALILLTNRIRPEAPATFAYFAKQGVSIRVISGDNPMTVSEVARRAGIPNAEMYIDANELETDQDFLDAVDTYTVFGRVTPDKKKRLIKAFKKRRHTVAMTGDGVNDVLAMKESDCGIAMASGAQAASQVAQLVLLNNDFSAMPAIVGEGRRVINNIQRAATLFLVKNIFSLGLSIVTFFTAWHYPIETFHLTILSLVTIGIPSFFLAMEPNYERVNGHFLRGVMRRALPGGLTNIFVVLMAQAFIAIFKLDPQQGSVVCFAILSVVGLLVLQQICKPFNKFRGVIWWLIAVLLVVCFLFFGNAFELQVSDHGVQLVMTTLLLMTPTVFLTVQRVFDWGDRSILWLRKLARKMKELD